MAAAIVVVRKIGSKRCPKRFFVDRDDVLEALSLDGSNQALDIRGLPGVSRGGEDFCDSYVEQLLPNFLAVNPITIAEEKVRCRIKGERLKQQQRGPFCGWMRRDVEVNNPATLVRENDENVENAKGEGRDGEEIDGGRLVGVVFQECLPGLGGRFGISDHVLSDGCLGDIDAEFEQFPVNSGASPERISYADLANEITDFSRGIRASTPGVFPFPEETKSSLMPTDRGVSFDDGQ